MSDVTVSVTESTTAVTVSQQNVAVAITETPTVVSVSSAGLQGNTNLYCGSFEDSTNQATAGTTSANLITVNTTTVSNGVSIVDGSKLTFAYSGKYLVNLLGQFAFTGGASNYNITVWRSLNGTAETASASTFTTSSAQNAQTLANVEDIVTVNAGDYYQFYWWSGAGSMSLLATGTANNPARPSSPSVKLNCFNVA
jgi:hypothetical protein